MFAARTGWSPSPNRLSLLLERRRAAGLPTLDLTETNPTRCDLRYPESGILAALSRPDSLRYHPHPRGLPEAREALAAEYLSRGIRISPDAVILTASTSEGYSFLFRLLADPGSEVLVPAPSYPLLELLAQINDVRLVPYPLISETGFAIDLDAVARLASGPRALLLVSPGNPTGRFLRRQEMEGLVEICAPRGIPILCDEVFGDYAFEEDPDRVASMAGCTGALTFVLNGLSKMLALPQVKLGWIAVSGPEKAASDAMRRLDVIADTFLSVNTPVQRALPDLLGMRREIQDQVKERLARNRDHLMRTAAPSHPCRWLPAEGGWHAILEVPRTRSEEEWALELLQRDGVLVYPGYFFEFPGEGHLVISLLPPPDTFHEGIARLLARIQADP